VVNLLTGVTSELAPVLAAHMDVNAIDLAGADRSDIADLERAAAENVKRVLAPAAAAGAGPERMLAMTELKTVWHPVGL